MKTAPSAKAAWRARRAALFRSTLAPPPKITVSEWADRYRMLSRENSAEPGKWSTDRAPYLRGIMDAATDPHIEQIVFMKPAQVGGTEALNNILGFYIDQDPCPILVVEITVDEAEKWSKEKLAPMLRDTPRLRGKVKDPRSRDSDNTILAKAFPGGHLGIVGANAPSGLRSRPRRIVLLDEVDGYPASAGTEGDPITLATKRTLTFWNRKIFVLSTPTLKGSSRIEKAYEQSDRRRYVVPCPHCGAEQVLQWGGRDVPYGLKWETNDRGEVTAAWYVCDACHAAIDESEKPEMLRRGRWVAERPGGVVAGFWINALYSPFAGAAWPRLAQEFLEVKQDPVRLRVFVNTVLAETWEDEGVAVDPTGLLARLEAYPTDEKTGEVLVPAGVGVLTRAVDVQGDRLETAVWGYGVGQEEWVIDYELIPGDPGTAEPWKALDRALAKRYRHELGADMAPVVTFVDSGGHHTKAVYEFTRARAGQHVYAIKGANTEGAPLLSRPTRNNAAKAILYMVGVFTGKEAITARLSKVREPGPGYIHLPDWLDTEQVQQLAAEKLVTRIQGGRPKRVWVKTGRNEFFDLAVYALAGLARFPAVLAGLPQLVARMAEQGAGRKRADEAKPSAEPAPKRIRRGGFVDRWKG